MKTTDKITLMPDYQRIESGPQIKWRHPSQEDLYYNAVYLHGKLESLASYDILYHTPDQTDHIIELPAADSGEFTLMIELHPKDLMPSIESAICVWWIAQEPGYSKQFKALVTAPSDHEALKYARHMQDQRSPML